MPSGFYNGSIMFADNVNFSGAEQPGEVTTDGELLIGSTASPNIKVGTITSPDASVTIGYSSPNITLQVASSGIETINGDSGSITGSTVTIFADQANNNSGATVLFDNSGDTSTFNLSDANNNTFLGRDSGNDSLTGVRNISIGVDSAQSITNGEENICLGTNSGDAITSGTANIGIGFNTISAITTVDNCVAIGNRALAVNQIDATVAVGAGALRANTTGYNNQAFGYLALSANTTGSNNTAVGRSVFGNATAISQCTGVGYAVGLNNTGDNNTVMGSLAFVSSGASANNALFGFQSGNYLTSGGNNTGFGYATINQVTTGTNNVALGFFAGQNYNGAESNNILIQNAGVNGESNKIRIGTSGTHNGCFIQGIANVTTSNTELVTIDTTTGQLGSFDNTLYVQNFSSGTIDFKSTGTTSIFTTTADFLVMNYYILAENIVGTTDPVTYNLGWTASAYDDFVSAIPSNVATTDVFTKNATVIKPLVPSGQTFTINVTTADGSSTTNEVRVIVQGFYV